MTHEEAREIANEAAQRAVEGVFLHLGVDITDDKAVHELKENFQFLGRLNKNAKIASATTIKVTVTSAVTAIFALLLIGFKDWIFK